MNILMARDGFSIRFSNEIDQDALSFEQSLLFKKTQWPQLSYWQTLVSLSPKETSYYLQAEDELTKTKYQFIARVEVSPLPIFKNAVVQKFSFQPEERLQDLLFIFTQLMKSKTDIMTLSIQLYLNGEDNVLAGAQLLKQLGFQTVKATTYKKTRVINLTSSEEELMMSFSSRKRTQLRKKDDAFKIESISDVQHIPSLENALMASYQRSNGGIIQADFTPYFSDTDKTISLGFYLKDQSPPIKAFVMGVNHNGVCEYTYGGSTNDEALRKHPFNLLLMWKLMEEARKKGCSLFDMGGITDGGQEDSLSNISQFKRGFPGEDITVTEQLLVPLRPMRFLLYKSLKQIQNLARSA